MPVPPLVPTTPSPLPTDQNADFDAKAFPWAASLNPFGESLVDIGEFVETAAIQVDADAVAVAADRVQTGLDRIQTGQDRAAAEAAALAAGVSSGLVLTGRAGNFLRVNAGATALEFLDGGTLSQLATTLEGSSASGIEINRQGTGDRAAFVDFHSHGLPGANDNSARILRQAGANGTLDIVQSGTGAIRLQGDVSISGVLRGGFISANDDDGTKSSGTYTPVVAEGNYKSITNNGAFTLAAPTATGDYGIAIRVQNGASAGAITFSGFTAILGDIYLTTNAFVYLMFITKVGTSIVIQIVRVV